MPLRVCCCFDGSEHSQLAIEHIKSSLRADDEVELLCCIKASKTAAKVDKRRAELQKRVDAELAQWNVCTVVPRENVKVTILPSKEFRSSIVEYAEGKFDMVVLGARGLSKLQRMVTGSVSSYVLNTCRKTPVYVVNKRVYSDHASYLISADGSPASDAAVEFVGRLVRSKDVVHIVSCYESSNLPKSASTEPIAEKILQERKQNASLIVKLAAELLQTITGPMVADRLTASVLEVSKVEEGLVEYAEARGIFTCIVMGSRGRGSVARMCLGSVSNYVLNQGVCPILVMKEKKDEGEDDGRPEI